MDINKLKNYNGIQLFKNVYEVLKSLEKKVGFPVLYDNPIDEYVKVGFFFSKYRGTWLVISHKKSKKISKEIFNLKAGNTWIILYPRCL